MEGGSAVTIERGNLGRPKLAPARKQPMIEEDDDSIELGDDDDDEEDFEDNDF